MPQAQTVAVVDDDLLVRNGIGTLIRSVGYRVEVFASAVDFLEANVGSFACVISDVQMPIIDGVALQSALRTKAPDLPIIFLTAFPDTSLREAVMTAGAVSFLEKPCDPSDLIESVETAMQARSR